MALLGSVTIAVTLPDGQTAIAYVQRQDLVFNPAMSDMRMEASLVMGALERLSAEALERVGERMHDWGETASRMQEEDERA